MDNKTTQEAFDPFTPEALRLPQSFTEMVGVKKLLRTIPCRKPGPQEFMGPPLAGLPLLGGLADLEGRS